MKSDIPMDIMRMGATLLTNAHVMLRAAKTGRKAGLFTKKHAGWKSDSGIRERSTSCK